MNKGDAIRERVEVRSVLRPNHIKGFVSYTKELEFCLTGDEQPLTNLCRNVNDYILIWKNRAGSGVGNESEGSEVE